MEKILAVDFDGTVVTHEYPEIGKDIYGAIPYLRFFDSKGIKLILWTMRSGDTLEEAIRWFAKNKITLWGINKNPEQYSWTDSPKAYAHAYIDDAAIGCPLKTPDNLRPFVDWERAGPMILEKFNINFSEFVPFLAENRIHPYF